MLKIFFYRYQVFFYLFSFIVSYVLYFINSDFSVFFIRETDLQADYFYKALSMKEFLSFENIVVNHPGIIPTYILAIIMVFFNDPVSSSQIIFNISYIFVAFIYALSITYFYLNTKEEAGDLGFFLSLLPLLFWPPFWYYLTCYGSDSFVIPTCIVILTKTFSMIKKPSNISSKDLLILGILLSVGTTIKLSILPIAIISALATVITIFIELPKIRNELISKFISYSILSFFIISFAAIRETLYLIKQLFFGSPPPHVKSDLSNFSDFFVKFFEYSVISSSVFISFTILLLLSLIYYSFKAYLNFSKEKKMSGLPILLILFLGTAFIIKSITIPFEQVDSAVGLRNASASICVLIFIFRNFKFIKKFKANIFITSSLIFILGSSVAAKEIKTQQSFYLRQSQINNILKEGIFNINQNGVDIFVGGETFNETGFHFYGNNAYAKDKFDSVLKKKFEKKGFLRIRSLKFSIDNFGSAFLWPQKKSNKFLIGIFEPSYLLNCNLKCVINEINKEEFKVISVNEILRSTFILIEK